MSGIAMEWARRRATDKQLDAIARDVLVSGLAFHAGPKSGRAWISAEHLASELHLNERTIRRAWDRILEAGILELEKDRRRGRTPHWIFPAEARWIPPEHRSRTDSGVRSSATSDPENGLRRQRERTLTTTRTDSGVLQTRGNKLEQARRASTWIPDRPPSPNLSDLPDEP